MLILFYFSCCLLLFIIGDDWHTAQTKQDSEYHILPSFGMNLALFNTVKPEYTQLPRLERWREKETDKESVCVCVCVCVCVN